jgi:hypothetical protein
MVSITIAILPTLEFFTQASGDANFRQQFILSVATLLGGLVASNRIGKQFQGQIILLIAFMGGAACVLGLVQSYNLFHQFGLAPETGLGGVTLVVAFLAFAAMGLQMARARTA